MQPAMFRPPRGRPPEPRTTLKRRRPVLVPIRRVLPLVGGVDLSPLVLLVLLQIAAIVLGNVQAAVLVAVA